MIRRFPFIAFLAVTAVFLSGCRDAAAPPEAPFRVGTVVEGRAGEPFGVAYRGGELFVSDGESGRILKIGKAEAGVLAEGLDTPSQMAFDEAGNLIVADSGSHTIRRVKPDGTVETVAGVGGTPGFGDGPADAALFRAPVGVAVAGRKIFVADTYNDRIRVIEDGRVTTLAGSSRGFRDSANGGEALFDTPASLAALADGRILVADSANGRIRIVAPGGAVSTLAGNGRREVSDGDLAAAALYEPAAIAADARGRIVFADGNAVREIVPGPVPFVRTISETRRGYADGVAVAARFNRPSGIAFGDSGEVFVADSENQTVRKFSSKPETELSPEQIESARTAAAEFRNLGPARWPYDPPDRTREIAGTLGEIRGEISDSGDPVYYHNGLDIVGAFGETARFVRSEKVLRPIAADNFGTLRELIRMPTIGYVHISLGRDSSGKTFDDPRFFFSRDGSGKPVAVRVARGTRFEAGEPIGTLNPMNHVHLIAGRSGAEFNALAALALPGAADSISPSIDWVKLFGENWQPLETVDAKGRITIDRKSRIVVRAHDRMDGNAERRRLGPYRIGWALLRPDAAMAAPENWSIVFDRLGEPETVRLVYGPDSRSGATGETRFNFIATNEVHGTVAREGFLDPAKFGPGSFTLRVFAGDYFGNVAFKDVQVEIR